MGTNIYTVFTPVVSLWPERLFNCPLEVCDSILRKTQLCKSTLGTVCTTQRISVTVIEDTDHCIPRLDVLCVCIRRTVCLH